MEKKLVLNTETVYEHLCNVKLTKGKFPIAFEHKVNELVENGMTREEAEKTVPTMEIELELYYHEGYGLFAVESDAVEKGASIYSPYNKEKYKNSNEYLFLKENQGEGFQP